MATEGKNKKKTTPTFPGAFPKLTMSSTGGFSKPASSWHLNVNEWAGEVTSKSPIRPRLFWLQPVCHPTTQSFSGSRVEALGKIVPKWQSQSSSILAEQFKGQSAATENVLMKLMQTCCIPALSEPFHNWISNSVSQGCLIKLYTHPACP